ncbi:Lactonase%2C 7-bladed beta-propeller [Achromobacter sp. 2789STDY5608615]|nr:Lactonase%2C 7-bladed beta-propeller [Achromobacter sp. 2789STDY5608615]
MHNDTPSPAPGDCVLAVGTYTQAMPHVQGRGLGIHLLAFEAATASFRSLQVVSGPINPSYLCAAAGRLYSVSEQERDATLDIYAIEAGATVLRPIGQIATPGAAPLPRQRQPGGAAVVRVELRLRRTAVLRARRRGPAARRAPGHRAARRRPARGPPGRTARALRRAQRRRRAGLPVRPGHRHHRLPPRAARRPRPGAGAGTAHAARRRTAPPGPDGRWRARGGGRGALEHRGHPCARRAGRRTGARQHAAARLARRQHRLRRAPASRW